MLNRNVRCDDKGWRFEADPRHAELIIKQLGVGQSRSAAKPGIDGQEEVDNDDDDDIVGADITSSGGSRPSVII